MERSRRIVLGLLPLALLLLVWWLATKGGNFSNVLLPRPIEVWHVFTGS